MNAYALTFAVLMLTGGKLADLFGRRRIFLSGLAVFTLASLLCGLAESSGALIGWRALQGVGAAMMMPATLAIITQAFPPRQRGLAIGVWAGVSALALAIGPVVGGLLAQHVDWSWIFFVNVPVGVFGFVVGRIVIGESRDTSREQSLDLPGTADLGRGPLRAHVRPHRGDRATAGRRRRSSASSPPPRSGSRCSCGSSDAAARRCSI